MLWIRHLAASGFPYAFFSLLPGSLTLSTVFSDGFYRLVCARCGVCCVATANLARSRALFCFTQWYVTAVLTGTIACVRATCGICIDKFSASSSRRMENRSQHSSSNQIVSVVYS